MLVSVDVPACQRVWVEVVFRYEEYVYADTPEAVSKYLLKYAHVKGTYTDEQVSGDVRRTFARVIRDGTPRHRALEEVSEIYGIPPTCVAAVVDDEGALGAMVSEPVSVCQEST